MQRLMTPFLFIILLVPNIVTADEVANISLDISLFTVNQEVLKRSAIWAFVRKGYEVQNISNTRVTGKIKDIEAFIDFGSSPKIVIGYTEGKKSGRESWLRYLKSNFYFKVVSCSTKPN